MNQKQRERYSRQIVFAGWGEDGQQRLLDARVAIIGCGALGSFQAAALARAGVGSLRLIDRDYLEVSNLPRQWLYEEADAQEGLPKAVAAAQRLARINSDISVTPVVADLTPANAAELLDGVDLLLDGADNFETRYLVNDYSVRHSVPWVYGAAVASYGLVMPVLPGTGPCLRCVFPDPPGGGQPTCETAGVINTVPALIAGLQASEALKILLGQADRVVRRITTVDVWSGAIRQVDVPAPSPNCPACALGRFEYLEGARHAPISLCGRNAVQIHERTRPIDLEELARRLAPLGQVRANQFALRFFLLPAFEITVFPDGRAIIKGTTDVALARSLYARYVGG